MFGGCESTRRRRSLVDVWALLWFAGMINEMITYVEGDLLKSPAQVLVNAVNTVGVMGKGVALQFKHAYPAMFSAYQAVCASGELKIGKLWLYKAPDKWILSFPTKVHWRQPSRLEYIEAGLREFSARYQEFGIQSVAFPRLGCGAGGLDWETQVKPVMVAHLTPLPIAISMYHYSG